MEMEKVDIDWETFNGIKEKMSEKFSMLLRGYIESAGAYIECIEDNIGGGNIDEIVMAAHSLKSASGVIGITDVHDLAKEVEYLAKDFKEMNNPDMDALRIMCQKLRQAFCHAEDTLLDELHKAAAA